MTAPRNDRHQIKLTLAKTEPSTHDIARPSSSQILLAAPLAPLKPVFFDSVGQRHEYPTEEKREDVILKGLGRTRRSKHTPPEGEAFAVK